MNSYIISLDCSFCGNTFEKAKYKIKRSKNHYCSRKCCDLHKKETMKGEKNHRCGKKESESATLKKSLAMKEKWKDELYVEKVISSRERAREEAEYPFGWDPKSVEKRKKTLEQKFGTDHNWKNEENRKKCEKTCIEKHGLTSLEIAQKNITKETIEKRRKTLIETVLQISYEEYEGSLDEKEKYYKNVRRITEQQPIHLLENYEKRGFVGKSKDAYHLDHIIPIFYGWKNNIDPQIIGDISNLRFIPGIENIKKGTKILEEKDE